MILIDANTPATLFVAGLRCDGVSRCDVLVTASYVLAIYLLLERYLEEGLLGENAKHVLERTSR